MRTRHFLFLIVSLLFVSNAAYGQAKEYIGHLVKASLSGKEFRDVIPIAEMQFKTDISVLDEYYTAALKIGGKEYYLKKYEFDPPAEHEWFNNYNLSITSAAIPDSALGLVYSYNRAATDIISPYLTEEPNIVPANGGLWIMNGYLGCAFLAGDGSIYEYNFYNEQYTNHDSTLGMRLQNLIGKVNGRYLGAFEDINAHDYSDYKYYIVDVDKSPYLDSLTAKRIYFPVYDNGYGFIPTNIFHLRDNFYLGINYGRAPAILELKDSVFSIVKEYVCEVSRNAVFRNNKLYVKKDYYNNLVSLSYNPETNELGAPVSLINPQSYGAVQFDQDLLYGALVKGDSVSIYDVDKEAVINTIQVAGAKGIRRPFIDSEYVYVHIITDVIGVEDEPNITSGLTYKLSAYPNPFNPQTTIAFTLASAGKVELAVYDLLGRKVTELLNEYRDKGSYEVKFNGTNLASGIYFYTIKSGNFIKTNKIILLK